MAVNSDSNFLLKFTFEKSLGESLNLVRSKSGQLTVLKQYPVPDGKTEAFNVALTDLMSMSQHASMVEIESFHIAAGTAYILCTYCEGGSLGALIKRARQYDEVLNELEVLDWLVQIALALQHLHSTGRVYRQLNPRNILLHSNCAKLSTTKLLCQTLNDLQLTVIAVHTEQSTTLNPFPYLSPQLIDAESDSTYSSSPADDMWSLGCVLYEMCARHKLYSSKNSEKSSSRNVNSDLPLFPSNFSSQLADVWRRLMAKDVDGRLTVSQLLDIDLIHTHRQYMQKCGSLRDALFPAISYHRPQEMQESGALVFNVSPESTNQSSVHMSMSHVHQSVSPDRHSAGCGDNSDLYVMDDDNFLTAEDVQELMNSL